MYYNMRHLLLSILVVSLVGILMIPNVFAPTFEPDKITLTKHVDRDQLFSDFRCGKIIQWDRYLHGRQVLVPSHGLQDRELPGF